MSCKASATLQKLHQGDAETKTKSIYVWNLPIQYCRIVNITQACVVAGEIHVIKIRDFDWMNAILSRRRVLPFLPLWSLKILFVDFNDFDNELTIRYIEIYGVRSLDYMDGICAGYLR